jgi:hypothetical protein
MAAISLAAWAASIAIGNLAARPSASFWVLTLDAALKVIALWGMEMLVFVLVPLAFLDGHDLYRWRPRLWLALWGSGLVWFSLVVLNPAISHPEGGQRASLLWLTSLFALEMVLAFGLGHSSRFGEQDLGRTEALGPAGRGNQPATRSSDWLELSSSASSTLSRASQPAKSRFAPSAVVIRPIGESSTSWTSSTIRIGLPFTGTDDPPTMGSTQPERPCTDPHNFACE